jgi:ferritin-like metal-binding protein YciE
MTPTNPDEQLTKYLTDAHSIEQQALAQMRSAPDIAGDPVLSELFAKHLTETEEHERLVRSRLEARGAGPATVKDIAGSVTGKAFVLFARSQPDTPGKLVTHGFSYEHMELAAYELLARVAKQAGDVETGHAASQIAEQERAMAQRLAASFDIAVDASLRDSRPDDIGKQLNRYLADAHAIEEQSIQLLEKGPELAGTSELAAAYADHLSETRQHQQLVAERLQARGEGPSKFKDAALRLGGLNWGMFFQAQPDTPAKLAAFSYALEHLEIGAYEQLKRVANRAGDPEAKQLAEHILADERAAAERIHAQFANALDASLREQGVAALERVATNDRPTQLDRVGPRPNRR